MKALASFVQWNMVVGFGLPWLIAVVKQDGFSKRTNAVLAAVACAAAAVVTVGAEGELSWLHWGSTAIAIFTVAGTSYKLLWLHAGEQKVESATSLIRSGRHGAVHVADGDESGNVDVATTPPRQR